MGNRAFSGIFLNRVVTIIFFLTLFCRRDFGKNGEAFGSVVFTDFSAYVRVGGKLHSVNSGTWLLPNEDPSFWHFGTNKHEYGIMLWAGVCRGTLFPKDGPVNASQWLKLNGYRTFDSKATVAFHEDMFKLLEPELRNHGVYSFEDFFFEDDAASIHRTPEVLAVIEKLWPQRMDPDRQGKKMADCMFFSISCPLANLHFFAHLFEPSCDQNKMVKVDAVEAIKYFFLKIFWGLNPHPFWHLCRPICGIFE